MGNDGVRLDREQLYELVWSEPISHIAPRLGLSDVGLAKICERLAVPRPGVGYWTQKEHGKARAAPELPRMNGEGATHVTITPKERSERRPIVRAPAVSVPKRLSNPHELVQIAASVLRESHPDTYGRLGGTRRHTLAIRVTRASLTRALRVVDAAIKALERRGHTVELRSVNDHRETCAVIEGQWIAFCVREEVRQKAHELTERERLQEKRWGHVWTRRFDYDPTGRLSLEVDRWSVPQGLRRRWKDSARRSLEDQVGDFVVGIEAIGHAERLRANEREERERDEAERRARALEEERRRLEEARRVEQLVGLAERWRSARTVREFLADLERRSGEVDGLAALIEWGRRAADSLDPLAEVAEIRGAFAGSDGPAKGTRGAHRLGAPPIHERADGRCT